MGKDAGKVARKSALRKPGDKDKSKKEKDTAKSLMKAEKKGQKDLKKHATTSKELQDEVLKRAAAANSKARASSTTSSSSEKDQDKSQKIDKAKEKNANKVIKAQTKVKKDDKTKTEKKGSTEKDKKQKEKEKKHKKKEKKQKEKDAKKKGPDEQKEKEEVTPAAKAAMLQKALSKESTPPPVTPPVKRLRMKLPSGSYATDASVDHYAGKKERAAAALHEKLYEKLEEAADDAELNAEMDAAGMLELLDGLKKQGSEEGVAKALKKSQQEPSQEEQAQVADEMEALSPGSEATSELLSLIGELSSEEADDEEESQEEEEGKEEEGTEDEAASDPESDDDNDNEDGQGNGDEDGENGNRDGSHESNSADSSSEAEAEESDKGKVTDKETKEKKEDKENKEGKEGENEGNPGSTSLVAAVAKTKDTNDDKVRNSTTNKKEWDKFDRQIKAGGLPGPLAPFLKKKKQDIFALWLDNKEDWNKVTFEVQRWQEQGNLSRKEWTAVQYKELAKTMDSEKLEKITKKRQEQGLTYPDEDFPEDPQELWVYMPKGRVVRQDDITGEQAKLTASKKVNPELQAALTAEEGPLPCGAMPAMKAASEAGVKSLMGALDDENKNIIKPKKPKHQKEPEEVKPKTLLEEANGLVPEVLDEATKARAKSIQLQGLEFASELSGELKKHGASMESYYSDLKNALASKNPDERAIKKLIQKINHKMAWFSKAEASATAMMKKPGKAKAKAKKGAKKAV